MSSLWFMVRLVVVMLTTFHGTSALSHADETSAPKPDPALLGVWSTHFQQTFITLIINPDHTAQFLLIDQGHSIRTVKWRPAPGGLIVDGLPRFRFWTSENKDRVRAQMEPLHPDMTNSSMQRFPLSFYMQRSGGIESFPSGLLGRPIPEDWQADTPPATFEDDAGRPRRLPR